MPFVWPPSLQLPPRCNRKSLKTVTTWNGEARAEVEIPLRSRLPLCAILSVQHGRYSAVKRREFITLLGGAVAGSMHSPRIARSQ
jgi:hypothetical protein